MDKFFLEILNMSITAGYCVIAVVLLRLLMKKLPKIYSYVLWAVVFFRLVCPVSIKSVFSFFKFIPVNFGMQRLVSTEVGGIISDEGISGVVSGTGNNVQANTGVVGGNTSDVIGNVINNAANNTNNDIPVNVSGSVATEAADAAANAGFLEMILQNIITIVAVVWITVALGLIIYSILSAVCLKKKLKKAVHIEANIYEAAGLETPFVFGLIRPQIYLPDSLKEPERSFVLKHELTHLRRKDYIIKQAAFFVVCIHWFNPLAWLAFYLMSKDMEMSCDESVIARLCREEKADYSHALLTLASKKRGVGLSPLAFGEGNVKGRIKNVLSYKKPMLWVTVVIVLVLAVMIIGLGANPEDKKNAGEQQETESTDNIEIESTDNSEALENEGSSEAEAIDIGENGTIDISEIEAENDPEEVIKAYIEYMGNDWNSFAMLHKSEVVKAYILYVNDSDNIRYNIGFLNVKSAKLLELVEIDFKHARTYIGEDDKDKVVKTYAACIDYSTYENNWQYANGIEYDVFSLILEDGLWKISEVERTNSNVKMLVNVGYELSDEYVLAAIEKHQWMLGDFGREELDKSYRGDAVMYFDVEKYIPGHKLEMTEGQEYNPDSLIKIKKFEQSEVSLYSQETEVLNDEGNLAYHKYNFILEKDGVYQTFEDDDSISFYDMFAYESKLNERDFDKGYEVDFDGDGELELIDMVIQSHGTNHLDEQIVILDFNSETGWYDFYNIGLEDYEHMIDVAVEEFINAYYGAYNIDRGKYKFEDGYTIGLGTSALLHIEEDNFIAAHMFVYGNPRDDGAQGNEIGNVVLNIRYTEEGQFLVKLDRYIQFD